MGLRMLRAVVRKLFPPQVLAGMTSGLLLTYACIWINLLLFNYSSLRHYRPLKEQLAAPLRAHRQRNAFQEKENTAGGQLAREVRLLIWVMTAPDTLHDRAAMVRQTWGRRVSRLLFFSSAPNASFPTIGLNVSEGREHLTAKTIQGFRYIYNHHFQEADWFMKVDDDTFVVVENLLYFLSEETPQDPVYYGHHFGLVAAQGYYSGGGGYVLSKEALRRFGEGGHNSSLCKQDGGAEDAEFGKCMERLGVKTVNTTDARGRSRFHCFDPETHLSGSFPRWFFKYDANGARKGLDSVSDYPITFHYIYPGKMQRLEFYTYHLQAYGVSRGFQKLNVPPNRRVPIKPIYRLPPYAPVAPPKPHPKQ